MSRHDWDVTRSLDWFLRDPRCRKWIVQCSHCLAYGRKPDTPLTIPKIRFEEMFPMMHLDEQSKCEQCQKADVKISASGSREI